ncbi:MAG: endopeptidase La [Alphaproteobacteria bacterium]|nr:MAG: endopeptidase La [Alphaproteobacteria bacterium]
MSDEILGDTPDAAEKYAVLPLRDIVAFPYMIVPLFVGREKSVRALEHVMKENKQILLVTQKNAGKDEPDALDLYKIGTIASILQLLKLPDGTVKVLVEGKKRARISSFTENNDFFEAYCAPLEDKTPPASQEDALQGLMRATVTEFEQYVKLNKKIPPEVVPTVARVEEPGKLADMAASHLLLKIPEKQELLEVVDVAERLERIFSFMEGEINVLEMERNIRNRVKHQMEKTQREYYLSEQMKAIQRELHDSEEGMDELAELEEKLEKTRLTKEAKAKAQNELRKLKQMNPISAEATVVRNYLDWLLDIPWSKRSKIKKDLKQAEKVLDEDHYGLKKVKTRILEYLAVLQRAGKVKGPILCLVGPPGVGKTSLGHSIARATNRNFVRISLGGVRDEAEIRGHRRTYIGAMPGKIIQGMKKAKSSNPLFLLDEIDKLGNDYRGDPSSALLEVLDPEQNHTFNDHYLEVDYDLSDVMFICTANSLNLPRPLLDRMEIIRLSGYTEDEKVEIAKRHLIEKQIKANGLKKGEFSISDNALRDLIRYYTREAGVRNLEREISNLARKSVKEILMKKRKQVNITPRNLKNYAGITKYDYGKINEENRVGLVNGLAWTETGGDTLSIEAVTHAGKGKFTMTGKLGEVMKESIQVAEMIVKSRAPALGIQPEVFETIGVHIHVPEGATPKDGPSAGIAMVTAMVSSLTGISVHRDIAMTGEVDLLGQVLPIGGLKEKLLAALRAGITTVLIPQDNVKDLEDIPQNVKKVIDIIPVSKVEEVLEHALSQAPKPIKPANNEELKEITEKNRKKMTEDVIRH